ncbi:MAG: metallophosphoesterase family protein [Desulfobacterales bacterium]|nr:metallophosphoesterase family protein [Desulfobacterales bacterium]
MKMAIISDIHSDYEALHNALDKIKKFKCEMILCSGDLVGYGIYPEETVNLIKEYNILSIMGNHDRCALNDGKVLGKDRETILLSERTTEFLKNLPESLFLTFKGVKIAVYHGSPESDLEFLSPENMNANKLIGWFKKINADVIIVGHTHKSFSISFKKTPQRLLKLLNSGSILMNSSKKFNFSWVYDKRKNLFIPESTSHYGTFGILELPSKSFNVYRIRDARKIKITKLLD